MSTNRRRFAAVAAGLLLVSCISDMPSVTAPEVSGRAAHRNSDLAPGDVRTVLGPATVTRDKGAPVTTSFTLSGYAPAATLNITNGDANGKNRTTSATVTVDGVEVVHTSDFNKQVATISTPITLANTSVIVVSQAGAPGSVLSLSVDGSLATSASVTPAGGSVHLLGDQVTITLPSGALSTPTTLTAAPIPPPTPAVIPGTSIDFGPSGTVFAAPITISIAFDPTVLPPGVRPRFLAMYFWNVDHWEPVAGSTVNVATGVVTAQTTHFSTYALLPNAIEFCPGDNTAEQDLQTGITRVPANGTLYVCNGTFDANQITIDKPMTITAENAGMATLHQPDAAATSDNIFVVTTVPAGTIALLNLSFDFRFGSLHAQGGYDQIVVLGSKFRGRGFATSGAALNFLESSAPAPKITVDNDEFTNSFYAIRHSQPVDIDVFHSNFHDLGGYDLILQTSNGTANPAPAGYTPKMRTARIQWNTFHNCGANICIGDEQAGTDTIRYNTIAMDSGSIADAIFINRTGQGLSLSAPVVVTDNTISGHGPANPADSANLNAWGIHGAIVQQPGPAVVPTIVERNVVNGALIGLWARMGGSNQMVATDNQITNVFVAVLTTPGDPMIANRNDFTNYHYPITNVANLNVVPFIAQPVIVPPSRLACNFWGSTTGPIGVFPTIPVSAYTPYSTTPIANQPSVVCDPGTLPTVVRSCPTVGGTVPTITTGLADAISIVPVGGTVLICDGTFTVNNLAISKPVTITAEGPGMPTIDAGGGPRIFNILNVSPAGTVTISNLRFTGGAGVNNTQILINNGAGAVAISHNEFHPVQTNPYAVLPRGGNSSVNINGTGVPTLSIDHNAFIGGDIGINSGIMTGAQIAITQNTFSGLVNIPVNLGSAGIASSLSVDHNSFADCSDTECVAVAQPATIQLNQFTARVARPIGSLILLVIAPGLTAPTIISGNTMTGLDLAAGSRSANSTYPVHFQAITVVTGAATITNNQITTVFQGIGVLSAAGTLATDNTITTTFAPFSGTNQPNGTGVLTANWNDITDYVTGVGDAVPLNLGALSIRCNWWGSAAGPSSVNPVVLSGAYTPFATASVANGPHAGCTP